MESDNRWGQWLASAFWPCCANLGEVIYLFSVGWEHDMGEVSSSDSSVCLKVQLSLISKIYEHEMFLLQ